MAKFVFSNSNKEVVEPKQVKEKRKRNVNIELIKHDKVEYSPEYYTYINDKGEVSKYSGIVIKDEDGSYIGKNIITHKVILQYHPTVKSVEHEDEYFSYFDNYDRERIFVGEPKFDLEKNTYYGEVEEEIVHDELIKIYKEV